MTLRVAVLAALQTAEYGTEVFVAGGLVLFQGGGVARQVREMRGQAGAATGCEDAPLEEASDPLQLRPRWPAFEGVFECFVQGGGFRGRELQIYGLSIR